MSDRREEELERRVAELESTVQKMLPNRRQALKGLGTAAGAGLLGFSAGNASAQASTNDGDGNVGLPGDRVDVFADGIDANTLEQSDATFNSVETDNLSASDATFDSSESGQASINNQPAEDPHELLGHFNYSFVSSISETVTGLTSARDAYQIIEFLYYEDHDPGANNAVSLDVSGTDAGDWAYVLEDETLTATSRSGEDMPVLVEPTATTDQDRYYGRWYIQQPSVGSFGICGRGTSAHRKEGRVLAKAESGSGGGGDFSVTFDATADSGNDVLSLEAAVWEVQHRGVV